MSGAKAATILQASLKLRHSPVAISFADSEPGSVPSHSGKVPAGCRFWENALAGPFSTTARDHQLCAVGLFTHHLEGLPGQQTGLADALKVFGDLSYVRPEDIAQIPVQQRSPKYVLYAPLATVDSPPDLVLLFVDGAQALIVSEATQQVEGVNAAAMGRPACAVVPQVMNTRRAAFSLGCCGARAYLDILTDDLGIFGIPGEKLDLYLERIQALAAANATLSRFHQIRRQQVEAGETPTIHESLAVIAS